MERPLVRTDGVVFDREVYVLSFGLHAENGVESLKSVESSLNLESLSLSGVCLFPVGFLSPVLIELSESLLWGITLSFSFEKESKISKALFSRVSVAALWRPLSKVGLRRDLCSAFSIAFLRSGVYGILGKTRLRFCSSWEGRWYSFNLPSTGGVEFVTLEFSLPSLCRAVFLPLLVIPLSVAPNLPFSESIPFDSRFETPFVVLSLVLFCLPRVASHRRSAAARFLELCLFADPLVFFALAVLHLLSRSHLLGIRKTSSFRSNRTFFVNSESFFPSMAVCNEREICSNVSCIHTKLCLVKLQSLIVSAAF